MKRIYKVFNYNNDLESRDMIDLQFNTLADQGWEIVQIKDDTLLAVKNISFIEVWIKRLKELFDTTI